MSIPGFAAEASLYKSGRAYRCYGGANSATGVLAASLCTEACEGVVAVCEGLCGWWNPFCTAGCALWGLVCEGVCSQAAGGGGGGNGGGGGGGGLPPACCPSTRPHCCGSCARGKCNGTCIDPLRQQCQ